MIFSGNRIEIRLQHTGEKSNTPTRNVRFKRLSGNASGGSEGVCDEASKGQQTRQSRRYPSDQDDVAQDADRLWRAGCRCRRDQDETKGDSDNSFPPSSPR